MGGQTNSYRLTPPPQPATIGINPQRLEFNVNHQTGILAPLSAHARFLYFSYEPESEQLQDALEPLIELIDGNATLVGIGASLAAVAGDRIPGLRPFAAKTGPGFDIPSTQFALMLWLRGDDRGELHLRSRDLELALAADFRLQQVLDTFVYDGGRDLTGYEDGTENPQHDDAIRAAIVQGSGDGLDGASFVAIQQWQHDFERFDHMTEDEQDATFGRRKADNEEIDDAPESAHVKRTAQESFDPTAFMLRRSMPWSEGNEAGLNFVAFVNQLDNFEAVLARMAGEEDGTSDALFRFTRPITGGYYWCPPMRDGQLDLRALLD